MPFPLQPAVVAVLRGSGRGFVVTPNERLGRLLRGAWERQQQERGEAWWEQAPVVSWRGLLRGWWDRLLMAGAVTAPVLSREQEARLWQRAVQDDEAAGGSRVLPEMAAQAAARLREFRAEAAFRQRRLAEGSDAAAFARWTTDVERWTAELGWVTEAELAGRVAAALRAGWLAADGQRLVLVGFEELAPAQRMVAAAWIDAGGSVEEERFGWEAPEPRGVVCGVRTAEEEVGAFARWAAERVRGGAQSVALVVPNLATERDAIEPVLRALFGAERRGLAGAEEAPAFEFSLGRPLRQEPMVRAAFDLLRLMRGALPMERLGPLLQSPYVAGEASARESNGRAALHALAMKRHRRVVPEIGLEELQALSLERLASVPGLHGAMDAMVRERGVIERRLLKGRDAGEGLLEFAGWAEVVTDWLRAAGWADGARQQSSREFQVRRRWERLVDGLAAMSFGGELVPVEEALEVLEGMAREAVFAPESQGAPVQVMGPREAAGCCFDAVWVLRAGGFGWGAHERPLPLLPMSLQEEFGMPGARGEREREGDERLAERLLASGAEVVFSYAAEVDGALEQGVAAAVRRLGLPVVAAEALAPAREPMVTEAAEMVEDRDMVAPLREGVSHGGSRVLELQAACGFRAFAEVRLGAKELTEPDEGLSGKDRGTLTHAAMDRLWGALETQGTVAALPAAERDEAVAAAVREAMAETRAGAESAWEREFLALQELRMRRLISRWLGEELRRPAFRVVQQETETEVRIGPLLLKLRVDRVDVDEATGGRLVVDYKTGAASPAAWAGERPDQPQLPLYAVALSRNGEGEPVAGVTFAMLRPGTGMGLRGVADHGLVPTGRGRAGEDKDFAERVREWEEALERLAWEFAEGRAHVRPKSFPKSCERCGQRVLCRVTADELALEADGETGDGAMSDGVEERDEMTHG